MEFKSNEQLEDLYKQTAWHFEAKTKKKGSSYDWFKQAVQDPSLLDECNLDEKIKKVLLEISKFCMCLNNILEGDIPISENAMYEKNHHYQ